MAVALSTGLYASHVFIPPTPGHMTPDQGYKAQTTGTLVEGLCGMAAVVILSLFL